MGETLLGEEFLLAGGKYELPAAFLTGENLVVVEHPLFSPQNSLPKGKAWHLTYPGLSAGR